MLYICIKKEYGNKLRKSEKNIFYETILLSTVSYDQVTKRIIKILKIVYKQNIYYGNQRIKHIGFLVLDPRTCTYICGTLIYFRGLYTS